jgi:hypothetical protein
MKGGGGGGSVDVGAGHERRQMTRLEQHQAARWRGSALEGRLAGGAARLKQRLLRKGMAWVRT